MTRKMNVIFYLLAFFISSCWCDQPQQIHLSLGANPTQMIVTWATKDVVANPEVRLRKLPNGSQLKFPAVTKNFSEDGLHLQIHRAILTNLIPGTAYQYQCASKKHTSNSFNFTTLDSSDKFLPKFAVFGDLGYSKEMKGRNSIPQLTSDVQKGLYDVIFHIGDIAYNMHSDSGKKGSNFLNAIEPISGRVPYQVCPGNHESAKNFSHYKNRFSMIGADNRSNDNHFYSVDVGPVHVLLFSTEFYYKDGGGSVLFSDEHRQRQYKWMEQDLKKANRAKRPWIIVMGHRPMYCHKRSGECNQFESILRRGWDGKKEHSQPFYKLEQLFYQNNVDLLFFGHQHYYERTFPLYDKKVYNRSSGGVFRDLKTPIHITTGVGGPPDKSKSKETPDYQAAFNSDFGFTKIRLVKKNQLELEQYSIEKNKVVDKMTIIKTK